MTIPADAHLFMVMEIMIQKHIRRLPVVDQEKILGIIYRSDLFDHLMDTLVRDL